MTKVRCSDHLPRARRPRAVVLEGMPGAGKTTTLCSLAAMGHAVVGEYITASGATLPFPQHPDVDDDDAHLANLLRKNQQVQSSSADLVFVDRDWLSALGYCVSLGIDHMLTQRANWVAANLARGALTVADLYVIFDMDITTSLERRSERLVRDHPWSCATGLDPLRAYFANPAATVRLVHRDLGRVLRNASLKYVGEGTEPEVLRKTLEAAEAT